MIRRSTKVQLLVFALVTLVTVSILSARFVGLTDRIMGGTYLVSADFADSGGIFARRRPIAESPSARSRP
jgi:hypothetical protein